MAIWQISFKVVPEEKILKVTDGCSNYIDINEIDEIMSWKGYNFIESSLKELSTVLTLTRSWTNDIMQFGPLESTCIELYYEEDTLEEISLRLDLRSIKADILEEVVSFIKKNKAILVNRDGLLIKPVLQDVIEEIKKSDAYSFIKNPKEFLTQLNS